MNKAYRAFLKYNGLRSARFEFEDSYQGTWNSFFEYAENLADEYFLADASDIVKHYFDYDSFAHDLLLDDYYYIETDEGKAIFSCY